MTIRGLINITGSIVMSVCATWFCVEKKEKTNPKTKFLSLLVVGTINTPFVPLIFNTAKFRCQRFSSRQERIYRVEPTGEIDTLWYFSTTPIFDRPTLNFFRRCNDIIILRLERNLQKVNYRPNFR